MAQPPNFGGEKQGDMMFTKTNASCGFAPSTFQGGIRVVIIIQLKRMSKLPVPVSFNKMCCSNHPKVVVESSEWDFDSKT